MSTIWMIIYIIVTLWTILTIIFYGSRPTKSLSWVLIAIVVPFGGPVLFYLFGVNRRKFKFFRLRHAQKRKLYDQTPDVLDKAGIDEIFKTSKKRKLACLLQNNTYLSPYNGNKVVLLKDGKHTFEAIFHCMEKAEKFIHLQYYILEQGEVFEKLCELFKRKIGEGVEVRIIYDSFGSYRLRGRPKKRLIAIGVKIYPMLPIRFGNLLFTLNYRNHRKIVIIDGEVGFTGGVNVSDKYIKTNNSPLGRWDDLHVQLEGPIVHSLHRVFLKDYHFASSTEGMLNNIYLPEQPKKGEVTVQIVSGGPDSTQPSIMQQYIAMANAAEKSITIENPYFIPGVSFLQAIKIASLSGIKVKLLVPKKSDSMMAKYSMLSHFEELMEAGVNIYLRDDFSHSKAIVVDNEMVSIGSGNFDYRSFEHNYETNALIYDEKIAAEITESIEKYCIPENQMDYERYKERSSGHRFMEGLAKFFSPLL